MMDLDDSLTYRFLASIFGDFYMDRYSVTFLQKCIKGRLNINCGVLLRPAYGYGLLYGWHLCRKHPY